MSTQIAKRNRHRRKAMPSRILNRGRTPGKYLARREPRHSKTIMHFRTHTERHVPV